MQSVPVYREIQPHPTTAVSGHSIVYRQFANYIDTQYAVRPHNLSVPTEWHTVYVIQNGLTDYFHLIMFLNHRTGIHFWSGYRTWTTASWVSQGQQSAMPPRWQQQQQSRVTRTDWSSLLVRSWVMMMQQNWASPPLLLSPLLLPPTWCQYTWYFSPCFCFLKVCFVVVSLFLSISWCSFP